MPKHQVSAVVRLFLALWLAITPTFVWAGSMTLMGAGKPAAAAGAPSLVYVGNASATAGHSGAVETYTNANIGSTAGFTARRVIFGITTNALSGGGAGISSVLINGSISPTIHVQQLNGGPFAAIFSANIPTGTTATVAVTYAASIFNDQQMVVWTVDDATLLSTTPNTGAGTASAATAAATSSFTQTAGGFTIASEGLSVSATSIAITGFTTNQFGGSSNQIDASLFPTVATGSTTAASTWVTSANAAIVAASWR